MKTIFYSYFPRDFNIASLKPVLGSILLLAGLVPEIAGWSRSIATGIPGSASAVMLAGLPATVASFLASRFWVFRS
ncbi:MAG TPA: hypothetical protein VMN03_02945 [Burkholderiales bacterium]|nr:hypothetical protein [Burkholderiales bacterium]